jgi:hypothetical protein
MQIASVVASGTPFWWPKSGKFSRFQMIPIVMAAIDGEWWGPSQDFPLDFASWRHLPHPVLDHLANLCVHPHVEQSEEGLLKGNTSVSHFVAFRVFGTCSKGFHDDFRKIETREEKNTEQRYLYGANIQCQYCANILYCSSQFGRHLWNFDEFCRVSWKRSIYECLDLLNRGTKMFQSHQEMVGISCHFMIANKIRCNLGSTP